MISWQTYREWLGPVLATASFPQVPSPPITAWSSDSRSIRPGEWFVPIVGAQFDGHRFIAEARTKGAVGFVYAAAQKADIAENLLPYGLAVTDTLAAFQRITAGWRKTLTHLQLAAVTGSSGKTTTKELLGLALGAAGSTFATQASFNNEVGVPKTLQQLRPEHRFAALEFGARMPGNIAFLCDLGRPTVAGLINVGSAHLGIFGSVENLLRTKLEIFEASPPHAVLVPFADDARILTGAQATGKKILSFGYSALADVRILKASWSPEGQGMEIQIAWDGKVSHLHFPVAHEMLPQNAAAAMAMALAAGAPRHDVERGLGEFRGVKGRYQVHPLDSFILIDDTYNANPASVAAGFYTLAKSHPNARKILILGDMLELGATSEEEHRRIGVLGVQTLDPHLLITVGPDARYMADAARSAGLAKNKVLSFDTVDDLLLQNMDFRSHGDVVYAKGSNSIRLSKLVDHLLQKTGDSK